MNPNFLINFFNEKILLTSAGRVRTFADLGISDPTLDFINCLPDNTELSMTRNGEDDGDKRLLLPAGGYTDDSPYSGFIRTDIPVKGTTLIAKCVVKWHIKEPMVRYDIYFDTPTSDGCLKVPVTGSTLNFALAHAQDVWDRLKNGGFVMKCQRPSSHVF